MSVNQIYETFNLEEHNLNEERSQMNTFHLCTKKPERN